MRTITASTRGTTIRVTLFGEVTPERDAKETAIAAHRADQLAPAPPPEPWFMRDEPDYRTDEDEDED